MVNTCKTLNLNHPVMGERKHGPKKTKTEATKDVERRHIPTDIYEEILLCLPANDLLNSKRVCKDWLHLISSPQFIQKHLNRSKACCNGTRILMTFPTEIIDYNYYGGGYNISKKIPYPPGFSGKNKIILGSCDGLICLLDISSRVSDKLAVFNPSTRKYDICVIDGLDFWVVFFWSWFGHHPSTGEYVLVIGRSFLQQGSMITVEVYKFSSKLVSLQSRSMSRLIIYLKEIGILLHGNLHWPAVELNNDPGTYMVLAYDLKKNEILEISAPGQAYCTLGVVDGCLFAILKPTEMFELWIMKEYGVAESWTKYCNIVGYDQCRFLSSVGFSRNGDLILDAHEPRGPTLDAYDEGSKLTKYSFNDNKTTLLMDHKSNYIISKAVVCADSLVPPALIWGE